MLASPFGFFRGAAALMAADLVETPDSGLTVQLCGDAHLSNFGGFAAPDRELVFDALRAGRCYIAVDSVAPASGFRFEADDVPMGGEAPAGRRTLRVRTPLAARLRPLSRDTSPFADEVPLIDARGTTWVEPRLVVEVASLELTGQHRLRQPAYLGVRTDLTPADLVEVDDA